MIDMVDLSGEVIRGYELRQRIGMGGFGAVYSAFQPLVGRDVAIKVILPEYANHPEFVRRFELEAQLVARLEHPFIIPLYDFWREPNSAYLVMRLLRGGSLRDLISDGPLALQTTARILDQVASALSVSHRGGVVHRDLKPANILLDEDGNAYLVDFGIAKDIRSKTPVDLDGDGTMDEGIVGSPAYLAPEQIRNEPVTPAADIYALGVVLYQMVTGQHPFHGEQKLMNLLHRHLRESIPSAYEFNSELPPGVDMVIQRATAKMPEDRYDTAMDMANSFWNVVGGPALTGPQTDKFLVPTDTVELELDPGNQTMLVTGRVPLVNPYKGLRPFSEADAEDFFGREALSEQLVRRLAGPQKRFLAVVGPSGSGKSSVVKAGLIPAIRRGDIVGSEHWFITEMLPGTQPMEELELALRAVAIEDHGDILEQLQADDHGLLRLVEAILPDDETELLLVIDQFEEIFTQFDDEPERLHLLNSLFVATTNPRSRLRLVITLRADFYDRPLLYTGFGDLVRQYTEVVLPLSHEELERAITGPANRAGFFLDQDLVAAIIHDVREEPGALPLLQYALTELFDRTVDAEQTITFSTYHDTGGVSGALARRAEELYENLDDSEQQAVRQLFLRLITLGEGSDDTRRRMHWAEVVSLKERNAAIEAVMDLYGKYRLLTFDIDPINRSPTVEIAHEALIRQWTRLRSWLLESREDLRLHRRLTHAAQEWQHMKRDNSFLATGTRLTQFEEWFQETDLALTQDEADYLHASTAEHKAQQAAEEARIAREEALEHRSRKFLQYLAAVLLAATIGAVALSLVAFNQRHEAQDARQAAEANADTAERNAEEAEQNAQQAEANAQEAELNAGAARSLALATGAQLALSDFNTDLAILLALEANNSTKAPPLAQRSLFEAAFFPGTRQLMRGHTNWVRAVAFSPSGRVGLSGAQDDVIIKWNLETGGELRRLEGHSGDVLALDINASGRMAISGSADTTIILWNIDTGELVRRYEGHNAPVTSVAFSPDGATFISASEEGRLLLWDVEAGTFLRRFDGHAAPVRTVAFAPNGRRVVSGDDTGRAFVWEVATGTPWFEVEMHPGRIHSLDVYGDLVVSAGSGDNSLYIWELLTGTVHRNLIGHADQVYACAFSPDGRTVLSGSQDATLRLWDVDSGQEISRVTGHGAAVRAVAYSPDGRQALSGSFDTDVRLWDVQNGAELQTYVGHEDDLYDVAISPDGRYALSGSWDNHLILWDAATGEPLRTFIGHTDWVRDVEFSPDGRFAISASYDGTVKLWNIDRAQLVRTFFGHEHKVWSVAVSPDGTRIVSGSQDRTARVWDTATGKELVRFEGHDGWIRGIAFSPDGRTVLSASGGDMTVRWWDAETGEELQVFQGHTDWLWSVAFSPDGRQAASSASDRTIILWDLETRQIIRRFEGHTGPVNKVVFSPFGLRILSGSADGTVRLWDVESGAEIRRYQGHTAGVWSVAFSPDGESLLSGSGDRTMILWQISNTVELRRWVQDNRYIRDLTCYEREQFQIEPLCEAVEQQ